MANLYLSESLEVVSVGAEVEVVGVEARHAVTVSRARVGEHFAVTNGRGLVLTGIVTSAEPARVSMIVESVVLTPAATPRITLVQALAKGGRDELAIQAATELGVDQVVPWSAERSIVRWQGEKTVKGRQRWQSIVREASKQSMRSWLVEVGEPVSTDGLVARAAAGRMLVLDPGATTPLSGLRLDERDLAIVVGPEGGVAPNELASLQNAGAEMVRLGNTVLRTSSAGPAALAVLNTLAARW